MPAALLLVWLAPTVWLAPAVWLAPTAWVAPTAWLAPTVWLTPTAPSPPNATLPASVAPAGAIALPGTSPIGMDYLAYDATNGRLWVPAGNSGAVDVIDTTTRKLTRIGGFPTKPSPRAGRTDLGPSSVTIGDDRVWIGSRADDTLCALDRRTLARRTCAKLPRMPDGIAYVAATHEVWVTTPSGNNLTIVDVAGATPRVSGAIDVGGQPEGYAVDTARGLFYTNLEDQDRTVAVNVNTRAIVARWPAGCGADGPRGLALDGARRFLFVACTSGAVTLDAGHDGQLAGRLRTGGGVDNLDYAPARRLLYVAALATPR